jgi:hypothetical protein
MADIFTLLKRAERDAMSEASERKRLVGQTEFVPSGWELAGDITQSIIGSVPSLKRERRVNFTDQANNLIKMAGNVVDNKGLTAYNQRMTSLLNKVKDDPEMMDVAMGLENTLNKKRDEISTYTNAMSGLNDFYSTDIISMDSGEEFKGVLNNLMNIEEGTGKGSHTLKSYMEKFAPYSENDTTNYIDFLSSNLGVSSNTSLADLNKEDLARFIKQHEGWFPPGHSRADMPEGSKSFRNNNPGNLKPPSDEVGIEWWGDSFKGTDSKGFAIFEDEAAGMKALVQDIEVNQKKTGITTSKNKYENQMMALIDQKMKAQNIKDALSEGEGLGFKYNMGSKTDKELIAELDRHIGRLNVGIQSVVNDDFISDEELGLIMGGDLEIYNQVKQEKSGEAKRTYEYYQNQVLNRQNQINILDRKIANPSDQENNLLFDQLLESINEGQTSEQSPFTDIVELRKSYAEEVRANKGLMAKLNDKHKAWTGVSIRLSEDQILDEDKPTPPPAIEGEVATIMDNILDNQDADQDVTGIVNAINNTSEDNIEAWVNSSQDLEVNSNDEDLGEDAFGDSGEGGYSSIGDFAGDLTKVGAAGVGVYMGGKKVVEKLPGIMKLNQQSIDYLQNVVKLDGNQINLLMKDGEMQSVLKEFADVSDELKNFKKGHPKLFASPEGSPPMVGDKIWNPDTKTWEIADLDVKGSIDNYRTINNKREELVKKSINRLKSIKEFADMPDDVLERLIRNQDVWNLSKIKSIIGPTLKNAGYTIQDLATITAKLGHKIAPAGLGVLGWQMGDYLDFSTGEKMAAGFIAATAGNAAINKGIRLISDNAWKAITSPKLRSRLAKVVAKKLGPGVAKRLMTQWTASTVGAVAPEGISTLAGGIGLALTGYEIYSLMNEVPEIAEEIIAWAREENPDSLKKIEKDMANEEVDTSPSSPKTKGQALNDLKEQFAAQKKAGGEKSLIKWINTVLSPDSNFTSPNAYLKSLGYK